MIKSKIKECLYTFIRTIRRSANWSGASESIVSRVRDWRVTRVIGPELKVIINNMKLLQCFRGNPSTQTLSVEYKGTSPAVTAVSEQYYRR